MVAFGDGLAVTGAAGAQAARRRANTRMAPSKVGYFILRTPFLLSESTTIL
jgi:hypothetical protein